MTTGEKKGRVIKFRFGDDNRWEERFLLPDELLKHKNQPDYEKVFGIYRMHGNQEDGAIWVKFLKEDPLLIAKQWTKPKWASLSRSIKAGRILWYKTILKSKWRSKKHRLAMSGDIRKASQSGAKLMKGKWSDEKRIAVPLDAALFPNLSTSGRSNVIHNRFSQNVRSWGIPTAKQPSLAMIREFRESIGNPMDFG